MAPVSRLRSMQTTLLVVDVQEKLFPAIHDHAALSINIEFLLDAAALVGVPALCTEQYPSGLGPTIASLAAKLPPERPAKRGFSCASAPGFLDSIDRNLRPVVMLAGIETHVCVCQTALDLLDAGFQVALAVDAVGSRFVLDHITAIERLRSAGALITTVESATFEWIGTSEHPNFRTFSKLVQERSHRLREAPSR